jgi:D-alanine-D-alanine ligase
MILTGKKIAVLMGGPGAEREVSLASGKAVTKALLGLGLDATAVDVTSAELTLPAGTDLAFNVIHGTFGEDGQLQDALEKLGVPYTGAGSESSKLAIHKSRAKERFLAAGVPTARSETVSLSPGLVPTLTIKAPLVIKPPLEGSSVGIQIVKDEAAVAPALLKAAEKYSEVLIEEFISGKELTVAILDGVPLPIVQIDSQEPISCLSADETRDMVAEGRVIQPAQASRHARQAAPGEVVRIRLCRQGEDYVYVVTTLKRDGRVARVTLEGQSGKVGTIR